MKRAKRIGLWTAITCGVLAGVMSTKPLELQAASQGAYLSDVIVITDKDIEKAKTDGYTVMDMPLGEQSLRQEKIGSAFSKTYVAYKTTSKIEEAIRDMKFMNMNGGFDFTKYDEFLDDLKTETKQTTSDLFVAIEGFRKYYKANTPEGKYAYEALNVLRYDEFDGLNEPNDNQGINKKLGDLFLDEQLVPNGDCKILTDIFMEGNGAALDTIYSALNVANQYDDDGKNILTKLEEVKDNYAQFADRTDLNSTFSVFENDFYRIRDDINWYNNSAVRKYEDFADTDEALIYSLTLLDEDVVNGTAYANAWNNAAKEIPILKSIEYKGFSGNYENLYELIMDEEADAQEYYPLFACMTPGVRATALIGILETLTNGMLDRDRYSERLDLLKNADEDTHELVETEGISVFYGVDRALFQKGNVAMTTSAQEGAAKGDTEWMDIQANREKLDSKVKDIFMYVSVGLAGILVIEGIGFGLARGVYGAALQAANRAVAKALEEVDHQFNKVSIFFEGTVGNIRVLETNGIVAYEEIIYNAGEEVGKIPLPASEAMKRPGMQTIVNENQSIMNARLHAARMYDKALDEAAPLKNMMATLKVAMAISITIAVVALVVTLAFFIINLLKEGKPVYNIYTEIPGILCHYQPVYDVFSNGTRSLANKNGYVYYYGATNPYTVATKARFGNDDDGSLELGENKRNVQDIFNWELGEGKSREWVCLYYTKDVRANYPITTSSLKLLGEVGETVSGATYFNNPNIEYDVNTILINNYYDDRNIKNDTAGINGTSKKYLRFSLNQRVRETNSSSIASAISNPTTWGLVAGALILGFGGAFLAFYLIDKKKKKSTFKA